MARFLLALMFVPLAAGAMVNPIAKVIEMINELQQKIIHEGETAQKTYAEFAEWCEDEAKNLRFEIKTAKAEIEELNAVTEKSASNIETEETKIEEISASISSSEADLKAATEIRVKEKKDFEAAEKALMDDIDTLERAIMILERELKGGASLMQLQASAGNVVKSLGLLVEANGINTQDTSRLTALLQTQHASQQGSEDSESDDMDDTGASDESKKSEGIVETMNDLLEKAQSELAKAQKDEKMLQFNYDLLKQELTDSINFAKKEMDKSKKGKAEAEEAKATAEGELATTTKDLAGDTATLGGIHHDCMTKASDFEIETGSRASELKALATAKKVIQEAVGGAFAQTYNANQDASFLQTGRSTMRVNSAMRVKMASGTAAAKVLRRLARKVNSNALAQLASRIDAVLRMGSRAGEDPFEKVKGLITTMVEKLMKEAEEEAAKKEYCDKEMSETEKKKDEMTDEIDDLTAKIDQMTAEAKRLKNEVAALAGQLSDLAKSQSEMDKVRLEEHTEYVANRDEMEKGIKGIQLALKVLRDYYAAEDKGHESSDGAAGGIIGLLEVVESDFSKGLEELIAGEESAQSEYEKTTQDNKLTKTVKEQDVKYKSKESKSLSKAAAESTADREGVQTELDAVLEYFAKIKEECVAKPDPYEARKARREQEIAGLKEALSILEGEAVLLQTSSTRHLRRHISA